MARTEDLGPVAATLVLISSSTEPLVSGSQYMIELSSITNVTGLTQSDVKPGTLVILNNGSGPGYVTTSVPVSGNSVCLKYPPTFTTFDKLSPYPIGTVFETKGTTAQSPASLFGGSWTMDNDTYQFTGIKRYWRIA